MHMDRRHFMGISAALALTAVGGCRQREQGEAAKPSQADAEAVKARLIDWYSAFGNPRVDRAQYRDFMTDDYLLCEKGELLDKDGDVALLDRLPLDHQRTNRFDFRRVTVDGDQADLVYFIESDTNDSVKGPETVRWLESAVMRKADGTWRCSLLHSTRITPKAVGAIQPALPSSSG
jgi:hypothetical protein